LVLEDFFCREEWGGIARQVTAISGWSRLFSND
jgi:hypothetical protein